MDASAVVGILFGLLFLALVVLVILRMSKKRLSGPTVVVTETEEAPPTPVTPPGRKPVIAPDKHKTEPVALEAPKAEDKKPLTFPLPERKAMGRGLERTRKEGFVARLGAIFQSRQLDDATLAEAEEALLTADIGVRTTGVLIEALRKEFTPGTGDLHRQVLDFLKARVTSMLSGLPHGAPGLTAASGPTAFMVVGVNGSGKTTTIGKMASRYAGEGHKVLLAAGDTFRAAGADQLGIWGERVGVPVVMGKDRADPASVIFDAARRARDEQFDLLIADTAGRLHTNVDLVEELKKVHRVMGKAIEGAPHEVILVLDATMGQNAVRQAEIFKNAVKVSGIALTKLDGTAKGGVILSIVQDLGIPVRFVGVGEAVADLRPFDPTAFADALFEED